MIVPEEEGGRGMEVPDLTGATQRWTLIESSQNLPPLCPLPPPHKHRKREERGTHEYHPEMDLARG
jgi:hypothetical protein